MATNITLIKSIGIIYRIFIRRLITRLTKYIVAIVGNIEEGIINVNYKVIVEVLVDVYFKVITKRNTIFVRS